jgi:hypothetical protein
LRARASGVARPADAESEADEAHVRDAVRPDVDLAADELTAIAAVEVVEVGPELTLEIRRIRADAELEADALG